jgi:NAD(P)-dependent dehydrogenase (short-subunit alcohol dehydrogenase family)
MGGIGFRPYDKPEYGAAKAGVVRLTASLATLKEQTGVRVNCICPGWVDWVCPVYTVLPSFR